LQYLMETKSPSRKRGEARPQFDQSTPPKQAKPTRDRTPTRATHKGKMAKQLDNLRLDSDDNMPVVRRRNDEEIENREPFANEVPIDETVSLSAIENYFLKGKNVQQNKKRRRRQKKDKRGDRDQNQEDEESQDEDKEEEGGDKRYEECDLNSLRIYHEQERKQESMKVEQFAEKYYNKWTLYLATGFNVLVHGIGSLRPLLHDYASKMGEQFTVVEVEGFRPECSTRWVLNTVYELLNCKFQKRRSMTEYARQMAEHVNDRDVILVIHNIDDPPFRCENDMEVLAILAAAPHFHIIASAQHVNRMFLWNMRSIATFSWRHENIDTWMPMEAEIFAGSSSLLGLSSAESAANHTISSLEVLWQSLNANARFIFHAIFSLIYGTDATSDPKSIAFWDLFNVSKDNFWVSSDAALRQQLVEFSDHRLIRMRRGNDGNEKIHPSADRVIIDRFLKEVEMPLEDMQLGEEEEEE
ncbi:hypothetical protein PENTCL1PPCAC_4404, partial [Pristionchus entomophagus]